MKKQDLIDEAKELGLVLDESLTMAEMKVLIDAEKLRQEELKKEEQMTPFDYFQSVKDKVKDIDRESISDMYSAAQTLMNKYKEFGQKKAEKRLAFHIKTLLKEYKLIDLGITKFVYEEDITNFIDNISKKPVRIIEMSNYPREIPEEFLDIVKATKNLFDDYFIVFTDYSNGALKKEVEKERDPILFGGFCTKNYKELGDRFYYLGDWVDEYCDLTLEELIKQTSKDIVKDIEIPRNISRLIKQLESYEETADGFKVTRSPKEPFIKKVVRIFKGG